MISLKRVSWTILCVMVVIMGIAATSMIDYNSQIKNIPVISVRQSPYFAKGNGTSDDTAAISSAATAACSSHSTLLFPAGYTFLLGTIVSTNPILPSCSNLHMTGYGATIKIKGSAGSFYSIWGTVGTALSNVTIEGLTIDYNSANNPLISDGDLNTYPRLTFHGGGSGSSGGGGTNIHLRNIHVSNIRARWFSIITAADSSVEGVSFSTVGGGALAVDSSLIYFGNGAKNFVVANNQASAAAPNTPMAVTMIETHASGAITGNASLNMSNGVNAVGDSSTTTHGVTVTGNKITGSDNGITFWSQNTYGSPAYGLCDFSAVGNTITVNQIAYSPGLPGNGVALSASNSLPSCNGNISDNQISFDLSASSGEAYNSVAGFGVGYYDGTGANYCDNCVLSRNQIVNSPSIGIFWQTFGGSNVSIKNNNVVNPGSSLNPALIAAYRAGIHMGSTAAVTGYFESKGNTISDNLATCRFAYGIEMTGSNRADMLSDGDTVKAVDGTCTSLVSAYGPNAGTLLPVIRSFSSVPSAKALTGAVAIASGSTIYSMAESILYTFNGVAWKPFVQHGIVLNTSNISGCGTSALVTGYDRGGWIQLGTSPSGTCTLTFTAVFQQDPIFFGTVLDFHMATPAITPTHGITTSTISFSTTGMVTGDQLSWVISPNAN